MVNTNHRVVHWVSDIRLELTNENRFIIWYGIWNICEAKWKHLNVMYSLAKRKISLPEKQRCHFAWKMNNAWWIPLRDILSFHFARDALFETKRESHRNVTRWMSATFYRRISAKHIFYHPIRSSPLAFVLVAPDFGGDQPNFGRVEFRFPSSAYIFEFRCAHIKIYRLQHLRVISSRIRDYSIFWINATNFLITYE